MVDHSQMKLGRKHVKTDSRTLKLGKYLKDNLPAPPAAKDWTKSIEDWGMMLNHIHGDCTIAAAAHAIQVWSVNTKGEKGEIKLADERILHYYEKWDGFNPSDPKTDAGGVELDVLNSWQKSDFDNHQLIAYADPEFNNLEEIRQSITLFGGVYIGLSLPKTAVKQEVWDVVPNGGGDAKPGSWGGHAVFVPKYDEHTFTCITWGKLKSMTNAFWKEYVDEAHALLSRDWLEERGSPSGFHLSELKADLAAIPKKPAAKT